MRASHAYHSLSSSSLNVDESLSSPSSGGIGSLFLAWGPLGGFGFNGHTGFFGKFFFRAPSAVNLPHSTFHSFTFSACNSLMAFHSNSILAQSTFFLSLSLCLCTFCFLASMRVSQSVRMAAMLSEWVKCRPLPPVKICVCFPFFPFSLA